MTLVLPSIQTSPESRLVELVTGSLTNPKTIRSYQDSLEHFLNWRGDAPMSRATVQAYVQSLTAGGLASSSVNVRLCAVRKMVHEAAEHGLLDGLTAQMIASVKGIPKRGQRSGNWLTHSQAQDLLEIPSLESWMGLRDRAILGIFVGCGLRVSEVAALTLEHLQQREGRWVILDLIGKRNRVRTVPMPAGVKSSIDAWLEVTGLEAGRVFRPLTTRGNQLHKREKLSVEALGRLVGKYGERIGASNLAPHDLRRTFAKLARKGGAALEQIQLALGHASIETTDTYLGSNLDLERAACDGLGLRFGRGG